MRSSSASWASSSACGHIALITTVQSVITEVNSQFDDLGANTLMVQAQGTWP